MSARPARRRARPAPKPALPACLTGSRSTELLVGMAHDLRSPLTAILTLAESMQSGLGGPLTAGQRRHLQLIHGAVLRLCETTSDTLELARGEEGAPEPSREFSLREMLGEVRDTVLPMAEEKGVAVELLAAGTDVRRGTERALRRTLLNLTTNALKVTDAGRVQLWAREQAGGTMEFAVVDEGPGMRLATLRTLWQPFHPATAGQKSLFSSAGLGLAICRKLVAEMGGELQVASKLGIGSRFSFVIPLPAVV